MSLSLLQGYSSAEEEAEKVRFSDEDFSEDDDEIAANRSESENPFSNLPKSSSNSLLPSALDVFSEIAGPPEFLNNAIVEQATPADMDRRGRHGGRKGRRDAKDLPAGVVVEAKAHLVGIRERVRSDVDGSYPSSSVVPSQKGSTAGTLEEGKRVASAANPEAKDAAELLRMCLQCGVPKTYSSARGMVCPICGDRPPPDPSNDPAKKKGSTIKDKEKSKRMKGQSSHSSWKSETEMQLRQQFD